jgi:transposase InsO family protein
MVETKTGLKLKCLRSDNGGEYKDGGLKQFCVANGIRMEKNIPGTPQQNGMAKRMNKTLNERARSMKLHVGLPKTFWANAVSTATYLITKDHQLLWAIDYLKKSGVKRRYVTPWLFKQAISEIIKILTTRL